MLKDLHLQQGFEVWVNKKLVEDIEKAFKEALETEDLYYYYIPCQCDSKGKEHKSEVKWIGKTTLIDFIKKVQKVNNHFCPIGVTNAKSKKDLIDFFDNHFHDHSNLKCWDYWIGDVRYQDMLCGDDLFITLWERIKNKATSGSKTEKKLF